MATVPSPETAPEPQLGTRTGSKTRIGGGSVGGSQSSTSTFLPTSWVNPWLHCFPGGLNKLAEEPETMFLFPPLPCAQMGAAAQSTG